MSAAGFAINRLTTKMRFVPIAANGWHLQTSLFTTTILSIQKLLKSNGSTKHTNQNRKMISGGSVQTIKILLIRRDNFCITGKNP
jgi:uncharacterized membrane protein YidH (DUF202 family)